MKVRLYSTAAIAAIALASQGLAQQSEESLERALAELNGGLAAPAPGSAVEISGDFRVRNAWVNDGVETNNRDLDTRVRLNFKFNVTESSRAFVGFSGNEAWGGTATERYDMGSIYGGSFGEGLDRAWVEVDNLAGDGGTVRAGRSYYNLGSGRLIGSETWDNLVTTFSGLWYDRPTGPVNFHASMMNGVENGFTASDNMIYVLGLTWPCDMIEACGTINFDPYFIRDEVSSAGAVGTHETWYGIDVAGAVVGISYELDVARYEFADVSDGAYYANFGFDIAALGSVPGIENGGLSVAISNSDEDFSVPGLMTTGFAYGVEYHDAVGFADLLGSAGIWTPDTDTWNVGINISPAEGWNGGLSLMNIESGAAEWDEIDLSLGTQLGGNVMSWFGYAWIDPDGGDNESVFWASFDLPFGG
jgi:hypothetical protein